MSRIKKRETDAVWVRAAAEDRAVAYLVDDNRFSPEVARAVAIRVEYRLALWWEAEQEEMRTRRDPREVVEISICGMQEIRHAFKTTSPELSDATAEQHILDILGQFPPDRAWQTARRIRRYLVARSLP